MQLALHSVGYAGVWPGQVSLTLEEFIPHAATLGYQGVMLVAKRPHLSPLDYPTDAQEKRRQLRELMESQGLRVVCLAAYTDFTAGFDHPDIPTWEHQAIYIAQLAELARDLHCGIIRVFTGYERRDLSHTSAWHRTVAALRICAQQVERYGVTLAVQNHHDVAVHYESLYQLLSDINHPNCQAAFDAWAPSLQGLRGDLLASAVRRLAPLIVHTTVADYAPLARFRYRPDLVNYIPEPPSMMGVPVGEGVIDYPVFFETLAECGYKGAVAYEMCSALRHGGSLENLDLYARQFLSYMRRFENVFRSGTVEPAITG